MFGYSHNFPSLLDASYRFGNFFVAKHRCSGGWDSPWSGPYFWFSVNPHKPGTLEHTLYNHVTRARAHLLAQRLSSMPEYWSKYGDKHIVFKEIT